MADELDRILDDLKDELRGLSRVLQSTFKIFDKGNKSEKQHQADEAKYRRIVVDALRKEGKINEETYKSELKKIDAQKKNTGAIGMATKKVTDFGESLGMATKFKWLELGKGILDTGKNFGMADKKIEGFGDALKGFDGLSLLGIKLSDLGDTLDFNVGIFKQLSQTGAGFGKSVIQLRNAATSANMPILDFVDLIQTNSGTFARLFGSVMDGIPTVQGFTRELRTRTQNELAEFGLNLDETSEFLATQLEIQRATGQADRIRQMDLVSTTVEYAKNLSKLSKLTGVSVKELDEQNRAAAVNGTFQATLAGMDREQASRIRQLNAALESTNPAMAQFLKETVAFGVPITDATKAMTVMSKNALPDLLNSFVQGSISQEEFFNQQRRLSNIIGTDTAKSFAQAGMLGAEGFTEALDAFAKAAGATTNTVIEQQEAAGDNTEKIVAFGDTLDTLKAQAESLSTDVFGTILNSNALGKTFDAITGGVQKLSGQSILQNVYDGVGALRVKISEKMGAFKEFFFKGEDNKGFLENAIDNDPNTPGIQVLGKPEIQRQELTTNQRQAFSFNKGSGGFQDFGAGTPAILHGSEAVVPENSAFGSAVAMLEKIAKDPTGTTQTAQTETTVTTPNNMDRYLEQLVDLNKRTEKALNTLVTIGAMTEKNTKGTKQTLANMGGSLV
jgi:hypothetical protein